jgi:tape measure domain-containing protein
MATENLFIKISQKGARVVKRDIDNIGRSATKTQGSVKLLNRSLGLLGVTLAAGIGFTLADEFQNINNRLRVVTTSAEELESTYQDLLGVSRETRSSLKATAELYTRLKISTKELGLSQQEGIEFTKGLNQALILSGASAREAEATIVQFTQGLASGALRGDELRSVLEQGSVVADVIATKLNVSRGDLRGLAAQGKLTTEVIIEAFKDASDDLNKRFGKTIPTLSQAMVLFRNSFVNMFRELDKDLPIFALMTQAIVFLADNLHIVVQLLSALAVRQLAVLASSASFVSAIGTASKALQLLTVAGGRAIVMTSLLRGALTAVGGPIGIAFGVLAFAVSGLFSSLRESRKEAERHEQQTDRNKRSDEAWTTANRALTESLDTFRNRVREASKEARGLERTQLKLAQIDLSKTTKEQVAQFNQLRKSQEFLLKRTGQSSAGILIPAGDSKAAVAGISNYLDVIDEAIASQTALRKKQVGGGLSDAEFDAAFGNSGRIKQLKDFRIEIERSGVAIQESSVKLAEIQRRLDVLASLGIGSDIRLKFAGLNEEYKLRNEHLKDQIKWYSDLNPNIQENLVLQEFEKSVKRELSGEEERYIKPLLTANALLEARADALIAIRGPQVEYAHNLQILNSLEPHLTVDEYNQSLRELNITYAESIKGSDAFVDSMSNIDKLSSINELIGDPAALDKMEATFLSIGGTTEQFAEALRQTQLEAANLRVSLGEGSFTDGFNLALEDTIEAAMNWQSTMGEILAGPVEKLTDGISGAATEFVLFGASAKETLQNLAADILRTVVSSLIKLGLQMSINAIKQKFFAANEKKDIVANAAIKKVTQGAEIATALTAMATITAASKLAAGATAIAWATPAALVSAATFGGSATAGQAALALAVATAQGLALASAMKGAPGLNKGGEFIVGGKGGNDQNIVPLRLTKGEKVTVKNKAQQKMGEGGTQILAFDFRGAEQGVEQAVMAALGDILPDAFEAQSIEIEDNIIDLFSRRET